MLSNDKAKKKKNIKNHHLIQQTRTTEFTFIVST
jgi:hypothetical protein